MTKQPKEKERGVQPFGFDDRTLEGSSDVDRKVHPKSQLGARLLEDAANRSVGPFSVGDLASAKPGTRDHRARPHGKNDGVSLCQENDIQPFSVGDLIQTAGKVDRRARPEHQRSEG